LASNTKPEKAFTFKFIGIGSKVSLELMNATDQTLKCIEILTVFLKDEETLGGGPSQAHIKFEALKSIQPQEKAVLPHRTWINGKPADTDHDQLERLRVITGEANPYVLDISWQDAEGKTQFQRIPVGH
jgi:hypothetical protein